MSAAPSPSAVAVTVALALAGLDQLKALEQLPTPEALLAYLKARESDWALLSGVCAAYLHSKDVAHG